MAGRMLFDPTFLPIPRTLLPEFEELDEEEVARLEPEEEEEGVEIQFHSLFIDPEVFFEEQQQPNEDPRKTTPVKVRQLHRFVETKELDLELPSPDRRVVSSGLAELNGMTSPTKKRKRTKIVHISSAIWERLAAGEDKNSPSFHRAAFHRLSESGKWVHHIIGTLRSYYSQCEVTPEEGEIFNSPVINLEHITHTVISQEEEKVKQTGFHFCPPHHPLRECLRDVKINAEGVFSAWWKLDERSPPKFSTFFPDCLNTEDALIKAIQDSELVARMENRSLRRVKGHDFYIEVYHKGALCYNSAFPVFFFKAYAADTTYQLYEGFTLTSNDVLHHAQRLVDDFLTYKSEYDPVKYTRNKDKLVLDIAPALEARTHIKTGILFEFDLKDFPDKIDLEFEYF